MKRQSDRFAAQLEPPPPAAMRVAAALKGAGHEAYFVGGGVRDRLLGRPVNDWDVATDAEPEAVMACVDKAIPTGLQHGTVTVMEDGLPVEVTTYRVERGYTDGRRPDEVLYTRELRDDLGRRDFTVNAMAWDPIAGVVVDPYDGRGDLERRVLRAVGEARERFDEDGLRALRAVRFACVLDLTLDPATRAAIPETMATFRKVSAERIRVELGKILRSPRVAWGLAALRDTGLLAEFLPEALAAPAAFERAVAALAAPPDGEISRLALALWGATTDGEAPLRRLKFSTDERRRLMHTLTFRDLDPGVERTDAEVRALVARFEGQAGATDRILAVGAAWARAGDGDGPWRDLGARIERLGARRGPLKARDLPLDGKAVMRILGVPPSRAVGRILEALLQRVWAEPALNTVEGLTAVLPEVAAPLLERAESGR